MNKCKIIENLYYTIPPLDDFEAKIRYRDKYDIDRGRYRIVDLFKWFESDFEEGEVFEIRRVSKNGKYIFK